MAKATQDLNNTTDYQLKQSFRTLFGLPSQMMNDYSDMEDVKGWIDDFSPATLPFSMRSVRIVPTRFAVVGEVLMPKARSRIADFMEETPDSVVLFTDALLPGAAGVYFAKYLSEDKLEAAGQIAAWYDIMAVPHLIIGRCADKPLILASAGSFKSNGATAE